nr:putative ribonuclease H-like domain-containing protein [Tanacetum cinerariifolium]
MPVSTAGMVQESTSSLRATRDKGKAIMTKSKPEQTTTKLRERQERAGYEAAIRLQEQLDEEENLRIIRDAEIAQRLQEEIKAAKRQRMAQEHMAWQTDYYIMKEEMSILRGRKSVPKMNNNYCIMKEEMSILRGRKSVPKMNNRIKREFSVTRTPQQDSIAKKKNRTLIEATRTMDHLGKFDGKADEGFFVMYSVLRKQTNDIAGTKDNIVAGQAKKKKEPEQEYILIPICTTDPLISQGPKDSALDARKMAIEAIGTKWVFRNKKDKRGIVVKNKARLVARGHTQEEGIDYDEIFAPVARIEAIRLFLAYASFKAFVFYQIDGKSAFLYGKIEEEIYICQPPGFEDPDYPNKVYKVEKALYGLHQASRACYETLLTYLMDNGFHMGQIDKTLFIKKHKDDILLVQVYVDDTIFGSTKKELTSTPIEPNKALVKDVEAEDVDVHLYRLMIGSLMYLIASRPDITFVVCACARF